MKKLFAIFLCLAMAVSFAACNKDEKPTEATGASSVATQATTAATEAQTTSATEEASSTEGTIQQETTAPSVPKETQPASTEGATEPTAPAAPEIQKLTQKEQFELLASVVGMDLHKAVEKLGWQETNITETENNLFSLPLQVFLDGIGYQVFLGINEESFQVSEVLYRVVLSETSDAVARALLNTVKTLDNWIGQGNELEMDSAFELRNTTAKAVAAALEAEEDAYAAVIWDYSNWETKEQKEFIEKGETIGGRKNILGVFLEFGHAYTENGEQDASGSYMITFSACIVTTSYAQ